MKKVLFLFEEEFKKILRSRYLYVFVVVFIMDIIAWISEYSDRARSTLYSTDVHVAGQGMKYLVNHEFGNFGIFVLYLLPLLLIASPIFSDESDNKILSQIRVTQNGRIIDTIVKSILILVIQLIWIIIFSIFSIVIGFSLFDLGISGVDAYIVEILKRIVNIALGCFCMANVFLFISSGMKNTVSAMAVGFATIVIPMFVETNKLWAHVFPVIGMQAECLQERSGGENLLIWIFYVCVGILFFEMNLCKNK